MDPTPAAARLGTISNAVLIGTFVNVFLAVVPRPGGLPERWGYLVAGILAGGVATGCYIGAGLGPGPRDGLMTGLAARGHSLRLVRTCIELTVLTAGWLLGGTVGAGTVLYAVSIGPQSRSPGLRRPRLREASRRNRAQRGPHDAQ